MDPELDTDPDWTLVDEASAESFPASDPPGWVSAHAAPSRASLADSSAAAMKLVAAARRVARRRRLVARSRRVLGFAALVAIGAVAGWIAGRRSS